MHSETNGNTGQGAAQRQAQRTRLTGLALAGVGLGMLGMAFAAVPLYRLFCQVTGYAGTTQRAEALPGKVLEARVAVRFDSNVAPGLDWTFRPVQPQMTLKVGEEGLAFFEAINNSDRAVTGTATFNVTPEAAGKYFDKIQCFCFTEQTLQPGERIDMPVSFFVDPAIKDDPDTKAIGHITLSYTFFEVAGGRKTAGTAPGGGVRPPG